MSDPQIFAVFFFDIISGFSVTLLSRVSLYIYRLSVETLGQMHSMVYQLIMDLHVHHM